MKPSRNANRAAGVDPGTDGLLAAPRGDGGDEAFRLVAPHLRALHLRCYRMLGSYRDAEEAVQEALPRIWRGLDGFEGTALPRHRLYRNTTACLKMSTGKARAAQHGRDGSPGAVPGRPPRPAHRRRDWPLLGTGEHELLFAADRLTECTDSDTGSTVRALHRLFVPFAVVEGTPLEGDPWPAPSEVYAVLAEQWLDVSWREYVTARLPLPDEASALGIGEGTPLLHLHRVTHAEDGTPLALEEIRTHRRRATPRLRHRRHQAR
jgi:hypothetical protein